MPSTSNQGEASASQAPTSPAAPTKRPDLLALERETMGAPWRERLDGALQQTSFKKLKAYLSAEAKGGKTVYPRAEDIYTWSRYPDRGPGAVRIVLVGQDPYHGPGQAHGLSFSVGPGVAIPPSLRNIYKELATEYPSKGQREPSTSPRPHLLDQEGFSAPKHGSLLGWAEQGVLLLNACLTVRAHQAGSHHGRGWEPFTRAILEVLVEEAKNAQPAIGPAQAGGASTAGAAGTASRPAKRTAPGGPNTLEQMFARAKRPKVDDAHEASDAPVTAGAAALQEEAAPRTTGKDESQPAEESTAEPGNVNSETGKADSSPKPAGQASSRLPLEPVQDTRTARAGRDQAHDDDAHQEGTAAERPSDVCRGIVFLAWGAQASKILADAGITDATPNTLILRSAHPSPLSAHRGFFNNGHFRRANEFLTSRYGPEGAIDWGYLPAPSRTATEK